VRDGDGSDFYYEGMVEDISERKMLEEELRQALKMEAVGTLAGGVAHDFNNILTVIMGFSYVMQEELEQGSPFKPYVDQILASSERAANLIQSLLAFSRKQKITLEPHDINHVIRNLERLYVRTLRRI